MSFILDWNLALPSVVNVGQGQRHLGHATATAPAAAEDKQLSQVFYVHRDKMPASVSTPVQLDESRAARASQGTCKCSLGTLVRTVDPNSAALQLCMLTSDAPCPSGRLGLSPCSLCDGAEQASVQPDRTTACVFLVFSLSPSVAAPCFLLAVITHNLPFHPFKQVIV